MSPTILWRLAVLRWRPCSYHREESVLVRLTTLVRTSSLLCQKWMKGKAWECWLHRSSHTGEREASAAPSQMYHSNRGSSETRSSPVSTSTGRSVWMCSHKSKWSRDSHVLQESYFRQRKDLFWASRNPRFPVIASWSRRSRSKTALSRLSEAEYHPRLLLEEQKLSEARSGLNMQELRVESADRALHEASLQLHSQRMELFQRNQLSHHSRREKERLCTQLEERERALQDTRIRTLQEIELRKFCCCTEAERAQQSRRD